MNSAHSTLAEEHPAGEPGFWSRQIALPATRRQNAFDLLAGILLPAFSLRFDVFVFRGAGGGLFSSLQLFGYGEIGLAMFALALWLWLGRRVGPLAVVLGLVMILAAMLPMAIGSFYALLFLMNFAEELARFSRPTPHHIPRLEFVVFLVFSAINIVAAFVYFRNAERALRSVEVRKRRAAGVLACFALGLGLLAIPALMQWNATWTATACMAAIERDDPGAVAICAERLKRYYWYGHGATDRLVRAYWTAPHDTAFRSRLAEVYQQVTGCNIEARIKANPD